MAMGLPLFMSFTVYSEDSPVDLSLEQDRKDLEKLREDIPEPIRKENDDLAFVLKLFEDKKRHPSKIQRQFDRVVRRMRKKKEGRLKKERDAFYKDQKKSRDEFTRNQKKKRKDFLDSKPEKDAKKAFFEDERTTRKAFYSEQKDQKKEFEYDQKDKRKEISEFFKDKRSEFRDLMREFRNEQKRIKDEKKAIEKEKRKKKVGRTNQLSSENQAYLKDFEKIPKSPGYLLRPPKEEE